MDAFCGCVVFPDHVIGLDIDLAQAVQGDDVKLVHRPVVLCRIARANHNPVVGDLVLAKGLVLQKLQHRGIQRLAYAVDLIQEQDAPAAPACLDVVVDRGHDLAHGVLAGLVLQPVEFAMLDARQTQGRLARVMRHGIRHDAYAQLMGYLLHDRRLADTRSPNQEDWTLMHRRDHVHTRVVFFKIGLDRILDLVFCRRYVHIVFPSLAL